MFSSLSTRRQHALSSAVATLLLGSALFTAASEIRAQSSDSQQTSQDAAEAARQERARKEQNSNPSEHHVYTNEDLRRGRILTPEDQSRAAAARQKQGPHLNAQPDAQPLDANSGKRQEPLGDVARRYRNLKRESIHPSPFHLPTNQPELAAPKMLELVPAPAFKANGQPQPPARDFGLMNPSAPAGRIPSASAPTFPTAPMRRVDPFSRRHVRPLPPVMDVRPNMPHSPAQPNFSSPVHTAPVATPNIIVVQQGDTLWTLSRQHLGRGTRWLELMAANPNLPDPTRLAPGTTLVLPSHMTSRQAKSIPHSVTVQAGDTLSQIALATYGHASAWTCIAQANPTLSNPHVLAIGQSLVLPASCSAN